MSYTKADKLPSPFSWFYSTSWVLILISISSQSRFSFIFLIIYLSRSHLSFLLSKPQLYLYPNSTQPNKTKVGFHIEMTLHHHHHPLGIQHQQYLSCSWPSLDKASELAFWGHLKWMSTVMVTFFQAKFVHISFYWTNFDHTLCVHLYQMQYVRVKFVKATFALWHLSISTIYLLLLTQF